MSPDELFLFDLHPMLSGKRPGSGYISTILELQLNLCSMPKFQTKALGSPPLLVFDWVTRSNAE